MEHVTLDIGVMSSSPTFGVEITKEKKTYPRAPKGHTHLSRVLEVRVVTMTVMLANTCTCVFTARPFSKCLTHFISSNSRNHSVRKELSFPHVTEENSKQGTER